MKTILLKIVIFLFVAIIIYLASAFIYWSFNPEEWGTFYKFILAFIGIGYIINLITF